MKLRTYTRHLADFLGSFSNQTKHRVIGGLGQYAPQHLGWRLNVYHYYNFYIVYTFYSLTRPFLYLVYELDFKNHFKKIRVLVYDFSDKPHKYRGVHHKHAFTAPSRTWHWTFMDRLTHYFHINSLVGIRINCCTVHRLRNNNVSHQPYWSELNSLMLIHQQSQQLNKAHYISNGESKWSFRRRHANRTGWWTQPSVLDWLSKWVRWSHGLFPRNFENGWAQW